MMTTDARTALSVRLFRQPVLGLLPTGLVALLLMCPGQAAAQETPPTDREPTAESPVDAIGQQASSLEADLGKYKDTSPEAAETMLELVDLYHSNGRVFGLIRVAHSFVAAHPNHPQHAAVMLQLMDGLQAMSRNNDLVVACRQFLARYPQAPQAPQVEIQLAEVLSETKERVGAAEAHRAIWNRQKGNAVGRRHGVEAVTIYGSLGGDNIRKAAELAEEMLDQLPAGTFAQHVGWKAFHEYRRVQDWAASNVVGNKLLQKKLAGEPEQQRTLHSLMASHYANLAQHANAVESYKKARSLRDDQEVLYQLVARMHTAQATPAEMEPLVNEYTKKHPEQEARRYLLQSYLAQAYLRAENKPKALQILSGLLDHDASTNQNASVFVRESGSEPAQVAAAEKRLLDALKKNQRDPYFLRYVLAFEIYRDRMKDEAKAKQMLRELIAKSPVDGGHMNNALSWLLQTAADDGEFQADVRRIIAARNKNIHLGSLRDYPQQWYQSARKNKDLKQRVEYLNQQLQASNQDPVVKAWLDQLTIRNKDDAIAREHLRQPAIFNRLNDAMARTVLERQAYYYRHYAPTNERPQTALVYGQFCKRFPKDYVGAVSFLQAATDYGPPEIAKEAALNMLKFEPETGSADIWRRLLLAADRNEDAELAQKAHNWLQKAEQKFGPDPTYASSIGDILLKFKLEEEAVAHWQTYVKHDPTHHECRECGSRLMQRMEDRSQKIAFIQELLKPDTDYHGRYAMWLAALYLDGEPKPEGEQRDPQLDAFEKVLRECRTRQDERPFRGWDFDMSAALSWVDRFRSDQVEDDVRYRVFRAVRDLRLPPASSAAELALMEEGQDLPEAPMQQLLAFQTATQKVGDQYYDWDRLIPFAQSALSRKDYVVAATIATGMLANIPDVDERRKQAARDVVTQSYTRMGSVGLTIDEDSPIAPLLQAALYLRLGDRPLALRTYQENRALFDEHRDQLPVDLITFVAESLMAAGGDENHEYVEGVLRSWIVKHDENEQIEDTTKAQIQLLLARNYFKAQRYDIARSEFTTVVNRYPDSVEAIEAEFGIGEAFMAQKVFDQAEAVFEKLARSSHSETVVRAEFLRGVLAFRRGDRDEARDIFRSVLERVPDVSLANQALFNLAEVYGAEERYMDQLNLLRTVGRLGRNSKRLHVPGQALSIVVHDSDLGISRGHSRIPVLVTTQPGGDRETVYLTSAGAGKGLFRVDLETRLGQVEPEDRVLQLTGKDTIHCDYPEKFKSEFRNVPLSDVEIRIASNALFEVASSKIEDREQESFSEQLQREALDEQQDQRVSQLRPDNQIKPGNSLYLRVVDPDRDVSNEQDQVVVKLVSDSGDQVQVKLGETGAHTGEFEGVAQTGELPAGALASDTSIDHSPLMAIDQDPDSSWLSQPDGAAPKWLTVDMKDLKHVSRTRISTPSLDENAPVRGTLLGSNDGQFWFRLASHPEPDAAEPVAEQYGAMTQRVYEGNYTSYNSWQQVERLAQDATAVEESQVDSLAYSREISEEDEPQRQRVGVVWHGKLVQPRAGAARISVRGMVTALALDGVLEMPVGPGGRTVDVWLEQGTHDLTIFAATTNAQNGLEATWARANLLSEEVNLVPFRASDFDLSQPIAKPAVARTTSQASSQPHILTADKAEFRKTSEDFGRVDQDGATVIGNWRTAEDLTLWPLEGLSPGAYDIVFQYAHAGGGTRIQTEFGGQVLETALPSTGAWDKYMMHRAGTILIEDAGRHELILRPLEIQNGAAMVLRNVTLRPASAATVVQLGKEWEFRFPTHELRYVRFSADEFLGEAVAISHVEIGDIESGRTYIPTEADVLALAHNEVLEIAAGDTVRATYTDEYTQNLAASSQLLTRELTATYHNASVLPIAYDFTRSSGGAVTTARKELMRVDPGERIIVEITDYDEDRSNQQDVVTFSAAVNDGEPVTFEATETEEYSGVFTKEVETSTEAEEGKLQVQEGDRVVIRYVDAQNTFPGHSVPRETLVYVNQPTDGTVRILPSRVIPPPAGSTARPQIVYLNPPSENPDSENPNAGSPTSDNPETGDRDLETGDANPEGPAISGVAFEAPLTIEVIDPDAAKDSRSTVTVLLTTTDGAEVEVECEISTDFADGTNASQPPGQTWALQEGRFVGQVILQLGGKDTPDLVPLSSEMPRSLVGGPKLDDENGELNVGNLITRVLNVTGQDRITATYSDERRPKGKPEKLASQGRLIANGKLTITDREYDKPVDRLHVGEKLFLKVEDPDRDVSGQRDLVTVRILTERGEQEQVQLEETLAHSGVFTGSLMLKAQEQPQPDNLDPVDPFLESYFGDMVSVTYIDESAASESGRLELIQELPVVIGTDGLVTAFTKTFNDEELAVETRFRIAESYFELFKSHKTLGRDDEQTSDLEAGRRVLRAVMEDYPDPKYRPRVVYLLGQFAQELQQWDEAIRSYEVILKQHPDHSLAPDAQYKLAQCYEEAGDFDQALEAYVTLAATYPKNPLIASVMIRIANYFYKRDDFEVAAQVGEKFLEKFEGHEHSPRMAFHIGQCYYKAKKFDDAGSAFDSFAKRFPDDALGGDALFWAGESFRLANNNREAFRRYNRCRWDYPESEAAKFARGRLALPEMLQQFEAEAASVDDE